MKVMLKLVLDCTPDAAWHALRSPAALREVVSPWLDFAPIKPPVLPAHWPQGEQLVTALALRSIAVGTQAIDIDYPSGLPSGVRMLRDTGGGRSGMLAALQGWDHRMAVSADPAGSGGTLYRDRLEFGGPLAVAAWYPSWLFWQWRGMRLRQLAATWSDEGDRDRYGDRDDDGPSRARRASAP